jgi:hypothetical protein
VLVRNRCRKRSKHAFPRFRAVVNSLIAFRTFTWGGRCLDCRNSAGQRVNREPLKIAQNKHFRDTREPVDPKGRDEFRQVTRMGPEIPCTLLGTKVRLEALGEDAPVRFDINTAPAGILRLIPGLRMPRGAEMRFERQGTRLCGHLILVPIWSAGLKKSSLKRSAPVYTL